ncbi:MAG: group I truncated hemoglobin [Hyphomicrobiales bacterium]
MKRFALVLSLATLLSLAPAQAKDSLYKELGGYDGIAAVTDNFIVKIATHPGLGRFFAGHSASSGRKIRQLIVDFICEKSGGPCIYTGRSMVDSHTGLKIAEQDWTDGVTQFTAAMTELKVDPAVQAKVGDFMGTLKGDIVGR